MAHIISKGSGATIAEPVSALAKSQDFGRQRDVYVLASRFRNRDCIRLWSDFQSEQPAMARLIVRDVENDRRDAAAANWEIDQRLREAEKMVTKARKPAKVTKGRKKTPASAPGELDAVLAIADPARREFEYGRLREARAK